MSLKFASLHSWCHFSAILHINTKLILTPPCPVWYPAWWQVWGVTRWRDVPWHEPRDNMHVRAVLRLSRVTCHVSCVTGTLLASSCCIKPLHRWGCRLHVIRGECLHRRRYLCSFKWWDNHHRDNKSRRVPPSIKTRLCVRDRDSLRRHGSRSASWQRHVSIASCHYRNSQIIVTIHHLSVDYLPQIS